jgi:hypothetical protein
MPVIGRARVVLVLAMATGGAIAGLSPDIASTAAATTSSTVAKAGHSPWVRISGTNIDNSLTTPSIARFGKQYEVVWVAKTGTSRAALQGRRLSSSGRTVGGVVTVLGSWANIQSDPTILAVGSHRLVAFGGDREGAPSPYDNGAEYDLTGSNGTSWSLDSGSLSAADGADRNVGTAVIDDAGTLITGLAEDDGVRFHVGASSSNPAPGTDPITTTTGNFSYYAGLGADRKTHRVWALWYSNDGADGHDGVWAQQIRPTSGTAMRAPGSSAQGGTTAYGMHQDLSVAARVGGGLYTAYVTPMGRSVAVWKVGAKRPLATFKDSQGVSNVVVVPSSHGRIWVYWRNGQGWRAVRSNSAVTRFGPVTSLKAPSGVTTNLEIAGYGANGPLEAIATVVTSSGHNEVLARQVLPRLSVRRSPGKVKHGHGFTVTVKDAGHRVKGAKVTFAGVSKKTNAHGRVRFTVGASVAKGKHAITVRDHDYARAKVKIKVT